jgi:hypothetical protein
VKHEANSAKFQGNEMLDTELASEWCALILSGVPHRWPRKVSAELKVDLMWRDTEIFASIFIFGSKRTQKSTPSF